MWNLTTPGRWFFAIGLAGLAIQQFYYSSFRPVFIPPFPNTLPGQDVLACVFGLALLVAALAIISQKKARTILLILGGIFLALALCCHIPFELLFDPYSDHIGVWTNAFKELAFSGGAFIIAGSYPDDQPETQKKVLLIRILEAFIPMGSLFFSITMIVFGVDHFLYTKYVATIVPDWIPGHTFWTQFAGVALIGAGLAIIFRIRLKWAALLLGIMIFLWLILLHIPRAAVAGPKDNGNELTSVFEALAFSGAAFVIGRRHPTSGTLTAKNPLPAQNKAQKEENQQAYYS